MAAKGKKAPLREDIESQEAWDAYLQKDGVKVVDAFTEWCGPCKAVLSLFRRIKTDLGDGLLNFATVNTDKVGSLKAYHGRSEPVFLFYAKNVLVNVVRGANGPLLERTIKAELKNEHDVLEKGASRKSVDVSLPPPAPVIEAVAAVAAAAPQPRPSSARPKTGKRDFTFGLIKPDSIEHSDAIFAQIAGAHLHVQTQNEISLTKEQATSFYSEHRGKPFFDALVEFMTSGPCIPMVLAGSNAVPAWRTLMGPTSTEKAKAENPESLRALFGSDQTRNAVHGADSPASAAREILFFFPDWAKDNLAPEASILAVRGAALPQVAAIKETLTGQGFTIVRDASITLTHHQAEIFAASRSGAGSANEWASPSHVFELQKIAAIRGVGDLVGPANHERATTLFPESFHARFSTKDSGHDFYFSASADDVPADQEVFFSSSTDNTTTAAPAAAAAAAAGGKEESPGEGKTDTPAATTSTTAEANGDASTTNAAAPSQEAVSQGRPSVVAKEGLDVAAEAQKLRDAFSGSGCDEDKVVAVLGSIPRSQRLQIVEAYNTTFNRNFTEDAKSELKGDFELLVTSAVTPLEEFDAAMLHHCLKTLHDSPKELAEFVVSRSGAHLALVRAAHDKIYGGNLAEAVKKHTTDLAADVLAKAILRSDDGDAATIEAQAKAISEANGNLSNVDGPLAAALSSLGPQHLHALASAYERIAGITLVQAVEKELNGVSLDAVKTILEIGINTAGHFATALFDTMDGPGTRDRRLVRLVLSRSEEDMELIKQAFKAKYNKSLAQFIKNDMSGAYERMLLLLIGN